jgi:hypothetical protein
MFNVLGRLVKVIYSLVIIWQCIWHYLKDLQVTYDLLLQKVHTRAFSDCKTTCNMWIKHTPYVAPGPSILPTSLAFNTTYHIELKELQKLMWLPIIGWTTVVGFPTNWDYLLQQCVEVSWYPYHPLIKFFHTS